MEIPSIRTPEGLFEYLVAFLLATILFFGLIFAAAYLGIIPPWLG
jgi:hypothetical protein